MVVLVHLGVSREWSGEDPSLGRPSFYTFYGGLFVMDPVSHL